MADIPIPGHVVIQRRDGRREVLLHRSLALISDTKVEIRAARGTVILPFIGLAAAGGLIAWLALSDGAIPFWGMLLVLLFLLFLVPISVMAIIGAIAGSDVIVDGAKGAATWQQGYLGMGIGTKELVPFAKIDHLEVTIEGAEGDRWRGEQDDLRQFALHLVKQSGRVLPLAQVPVPAYGQYDGMDRTLAVAHAIAALAGTTVKLPEGWELTEIDTETGEPVPPPQARAAHHRTKRRRR